MESRGNKIKFTIFIIFLFAIGIGGYFRMRYVLKNSTSIWEEPPEKEDKVPDLRIDKTKDYVYYTDIQEILEDLGVYMKDININLSSGKLISETLNNEMSEIRNTIVKTEDVKMDPNKEYAENEEGIFSLDFREYVEHDYEQYISLIAEDYKYDITNIENTTTATGVKAYIFDKYEDRVVSSTELLEKYNKTLDEIKTEIKTKLTSVQEVVNGVQLIKIDETMSNLNYALFINKTGKLEVFYLVKSTNGDYYDNIVIS